MTNGLAHPTGEPLVRKREAQADKNRKPQANMLPVLFVNYLQSMNFTPKLIYMYI